MAINPDSLNFSDAVDYHYDQFPPTKIRMEEIITPLADAATALGRYDQMLKGLHNSEILLAPLRNQEAVVSSRMEGTISTLDEVLRYEADQEDGINNPSTYRFEALEVVLYSRAMRIAQEQIQEGQPLSKHLIKSMHKMLLGFGRGAKLSPGEFKTEQNYLADRSKRKILFIPIRPEQLEPSFDAMIEYINHDQSQILLRTAMAHLEFEALHPFKDGNGRVGRMLITLMLWHFDVVSAPHFYVSNYFEDNRDEYIDKMREVSKSGNWTEWIVFFLNAMTTQAMENIEKAEQIHALYDQMKIELREKLSSQWGTTALDFLFSRPIFRNNIFTTRSGIPAPTAHRFTKKLVDEGVLTILEPSAGQRAALYSFEPLLSLVRS